MLVWLENCHYLVWNFFVKSACWILWPYNYVYKDQVCANFHWIALIYFPLAIRIVGCVEYVTLLFLSMLQAIHPNYLGVSVAEFAGLVLIPSISLDL